MVDLWQKQKDMVYVYYVLSYHTVAIATSSDKGRRQSSNFYRCLLAWTGQDVLI